MERLGNTKPAGLSASALRAWGILFAAAGVIGRGILQNKILGVGTRSAQQLLEAMQASSEAMTIATVALVLQALETLAVPVFVFLLLQGFLHTKDFKKYFLRVAGTALLSEIPYNLAMSTKVIDLSSRNPMFGLAVCLILLYLYDHFRQQKLLYCVVAALAAAGWVWMLKIDHGIPMLLMITVIWIFRKKPMLMGFSGATAAILCTVSSVFYLAAPMGFLATHFYNGEQGESSRLVNYLLYPAVLLIIGLAAKFFI